MSRRNFAAALLERLGGDVAPPPEPHAKAPPHAPKGKRPKHWGCPFHGTKLGRDDSCDTPGLLPGTRACARGAGRRHLREMRLCECDLCRALLDVLREKPGPDRREAEREAVDRTFPNVTV